MEIDNKNHDELINRYISGEMSEEERSDFLTSLETDEGLKLRAQMVGLIAREIHHVNSEDTIIDALSKTDKDDFRKTLLKLKKEKYTSEVSACSIEDGICIRKGEYKKRMVRRTVYSIAAGIIVIIGIFTIYQKMSSPDLVGIGNGQELQMITYSRGTEDSLMVVDLNESFDVIKTGNARDAVNKLTELLSQAKNNPTIENHRTDIMWNLAIAYMKLEDKANAIKSLEEVVSSAEGAPLASKAKQLIKELE